MKALSNGFVFDTDCRTTKLVANFENVNGTLKVYRTESDRYFTHFQPSESFIEQEGGIEMIVHLEGGYDEFEALIDELSCPCETCGEEQGKLSVYFEEFPKG